MEDSAIKQVLDGYASAVRAKDVESFVSLYTEDVRVFDMWERWAYEGLSAWRNMAEEWFGSLGDEQVAVEFEEVQTVVGEDMAITDTFVTYKGLAADGTELRAMSNRLTWALQKTADDGWKVVHQHSSAPAAFETGKVQLQRPATG
jgi:uncharacterized protein (TIGR02246 family)